MKMQSNSKKTKRTTLLQELFCQKNRFGTMVKKMYFCEIELVFKNFKIQNV